MIKIGANVVRHGRYATFQMAEVAISRDLFANMLRLIAELRPPPAASTAQRVRQAPRDTCVMVEKHLAFRSVDTASAHLGASSRRAGGASANASRSLWRKTVK
jgi:hypothetical protein